MALSIQSNAASKAIQTQLSRTNSDLSVALQRLGSGLKINSSKDDAAGLQIANRLNAQVRGQEAALYNANNASSMLKTADGAFEEMTNIAYRIKELSTQAANGTNNTSEYTAINGEVKALSAELLNIMDNTTFGSGTNLFANTTGKLAAAAGVTFQIGANSSETLAVSVGTDVGTVRTSIGAAGNALGATADITDRATATAVMAGADTLINNIGKVRSSLGASMNRLDHSINNVTNMKQNTEAAAGQLMDADYAKETSRMTKQQLLLNSGVSVLSSSNSTTQLIGSLLR